MCQAKEMQRAELEELRQREANLTALHAIGSRKKPRLDGAGDVAATTSSATTSHNMVSYETNLMVAVKCAPISLASLNLESYFWESIIVNQYQYKKTNTI